MRKIENIEELKGIQLNILKNVADFCEKNNITYWLSFGTLLGAVRHKGFIPWDDDIDIAMTRENYDKFISEYSDKTGRYSFHCVENDDKYCYPMGKVFDNNTVLYELDKKRGYKIAVYIDVFVQDSIPDDHKIINKLYDKRDFYLHIRILQKSKEHKGNIIRQVCVHGIARLLSLIPTRCITEKIVHNGKEYRYSDTSYYGNLVGNSRLIINKELMDNVEKMEFEGEYYNVPIGYKEILTAIYGDYMELPPEEKRIPLHQVEAYYIDE